MCIFVPHDAAGDERAALEAFNKAQGDAVGELLDKWSDEDWAEVGRQIAEDGASYA